MPEESPLDWVKELEIDDLLDNDIKFIYDSCGLDLLLQLWENFPKMTLYISTKPLTEAKKRYIKKHFNNKNVKELCRKLDVAERFIYEAVSTSKPLEGQETLF